MDQKTIQSISSQIYRQFPEVAGSKPKMRKQQAGSPTGTKNAPTYLLIYHTRIDGGAGKSFQRWVRVTSDAQGHILKISTSH